MEVIIPPRYTGLILAWPRAGEEVSSIFFDSVISIFRISHLTLSIFLRPPPANMLYKAALREAAAVVSEEDERPPATFNPNAPHPYTLALGVLSVQKVGQGSSLIITCV